MLNVRCASLLVTKITFLIAYFFSSTITGSFRAWVSDKMGDPTAKLAGFLTLNPLMHVDPIGVVFLLLTQFGWGRMVPINPQNIDDSCAFVGARSGWRIPKLLIAYFSETVAYFVLAIVSLVGLVVLFGPAVLAFAGATIMQGECPPHLVIAHAFPHHSSLIIALGFILLVTSHLSTILGVLNGIINACYLGIMLVADRFESTQMFLLANALPIALILFLARPLRFFIAGLVVHGGNILVRLLGLI